MIYKGMICFCMILLSYAGGVLYTWRFTGRTALLRDVQNKLDSMEREVLFSQNPLPEICAALSGEPGGFSCVMRRIAERIGGQGEAFALVWKEAVETCLAQSFLKQEQIAALAGLGRGLGEGDLGEQEKCFQRIRRELDRMLAEAEEEKKRLKKMYLSLFLFGGIGISIILV